MRPNNTRMPQTPFGFGRLEKPTSFIKLKYWAPQISWLGAFEFTQGALTSNVMSIMSKRLKFAYFVLFEFRHFE